jgi:transcriptional regulator with XRE-family HTH domain
MSILPDPRYSHIASLIRSALTANDWKVSEMNAKLGYKKGATTIYPWLSGTSAPSDYLRPGLAKLLKVSEEELMPKENVTLQKPKTSVVVYHPKTKTIPVIPTIDPLTFVITNDGQARIRLDVTLPLEDATPLLRMLLDANLIKQQG